MLQPTVIFRQGMALPYVTRWTSYAPVPGHPNEDHTQITWYTRKLPGKLL